MQIADRHPAFDFSFRLLPVACCLLFLLSCAGPPPLRRVLPAPTAADLLKRAADDIARLNTLEGEARISLRLEGTRQNASLLVLFRRPADLRLEVTGPLGVRLLTAVALRDSLRAYLPRTNNLYEGPADGDVLRRITGVDLGAWAFWRAVLGIALLDSAQAGELRREGNRLIVRISETAGSRRLLFDARSLTLSEEEVYNPEGGLVARRTMSDYRETDGVVLPRRIAIFHGGDEIRLEYGEVKVNGAIVEEAFRLRVPEGVNRVE